VPNAITFLINAKYKTMNRPEKKNRKLNFGLTRRLIELHAKGYHFDYFVMHKGQLSCIQNSLAIPINAVHINVVDQVYDQLDQSFKYIHTIDTGNGEMGVMVTEAIVTNQAII
jgi:hypothetical protein